MAAWKSLACMAPCGERCERTHLGKLLQLLCSQPALLVFPGSSSLFCGMSGKVSCSSSSNGQNFKVQSEVREGVRPSFYLKALGNPSVPHPAAKLRIQGRVISSCHIGGLPHLFSVGKTYPRKHLTSHCCASAVEGGSKPALHLCILSAISSWRFFFSMYLKKPWQMFQKWGSFCSDFLSFFKNKTSLWGQRIREAVVM